MGKHHAQEQTQHTTLFTREHTVTHCSWYNKQHNKNSYAWIKKILKLGSQELMKIFPFMSEDLLLL